MTKTLTVASLLVLVAGSSSVLAASPEPLFVQQDLFRRGDRGYHMYHIPSLIVTTSGTVLTFCEARKNSGGDHGDIDLAMRRSDDGGRTWGPMSIIGR
jgi:sialidase-1